MKDQRMEDLGPEGRRLFNSTQLIQILIAAIFAGGASFGGIKIVASDTAGAINELEKKSIVLEQTIDKIEKIDTLKQSRVNEKFQELRSDIQELKTQFDEFQKEQREVNKELMETMRKLLEKQ